MSLQQWIDKYEVDLINLRRHFHQNPELSLKEYNTSKRIQQELDASGIDYQLVGETGVIAFITGKKQGEYKVVGLRGDMDALPISDQKEIGYKSKNQGVMHACGHDAHTASLIYAAKVLKQMEEEFSGEVRFIFQQAEEIGAGAKQFIAAGYLKEVDQIFGIHVASDLPVGKIAAMSGPISASCDYFSIKIQGKKGHASTPEKGIDAIYIASSIVVQLQAIVSRMSSPLEPVVIGIGKISGGDGYNIIASEVIMEGTTRSFTLEGRKKNNELVQKIAEDIAGIYGATAEVVFKDFASPVINHDKSAKLAANAAKKVVGDENVLEEGKKSLGADDFAEFLLEVPGAYIKVGTRNEAIENSCQALHHQQFDVDESALKIMTKAYVQFALDTLVAE